MYLLLERSCNNTSISGHQVSILKAFEALCVPTLHKCKKTSDEVAFKVDVGMCLLDVLEVTSPATASEVLLTRELFSGNASAVN